MLWFPGNRHHPRLHTLNPDRQRVPRRRILALAIGATGMLTILASGLTLSLVHAITHHTPPATTVADPVIEPVNAAVQAARDQVAARPLPDTGNGRSYGRPDTPATTTPPPILLPPPDPDPDSDSAATIAAVQTGYPDTPAGAVAQLAAIETAVISSATVTGTQDIITAWAAPDGPTATTWSWPSAMADLLADLGLALTGSTNLTMTAHPAMGQIKDTHGLDVGDHWHVVCIDLVVDITLPHQATQITIADCQRMTWDTTRWIIAAGTEPAMPPAAPWPGTDAAYQAGYRDLRTETPLQQAIP